jgi:hypothetical protein
MPDVFAVSDRRRAPPRRKVADKPIAATSAGGDRADHRRDRGGVKALQIGRTRAKVRAPPTARDDREETK